MLSGEAYGCDSSEGSPTIATPGETSDAAMFSEEAILVAHRDVLDDVQGERRIERRSLNRPGQHVVDAQLELPGRFHRPTRILDEHRIEVDPDQRLRLLAGQVRLRHA